MCVCVSVGKKDLKNTSSRIAKAFKFKDIILNEKQQNYVGTFLYLIQVKAVLSAVISATYYWFLGSTTFEIAHRSYGQQLKYAKIQAYTESTGNV